MSITVSGRVNQKYIDEQMFRESIERFFQNQDGYVYNQKTECFVFEGIGKSGELTVSFIDDKKAPYNIYDSEILGNEYQYMQLIIFDIDKEFATNELYRNIIDYFVFLRNTIEGESW